MIDGGLRATFRAKLPDIHWQAVESKLTGKGIPDANYCAEGIEGWVEFKKTSGWKIGLRTEQTSWIEKRARFGGNVFIAVRRKGTELWLCGPEHARGNTLKGITPILFYDKVWNWAEIRRKLIS
jgi:Holliday junction resolvase